MDDSRYQQILNDIEQETNVQKSLSVFQGFGRSTDVAEKVNKIEAEGQKRIEALSIVLSLEKLAAQGEDVGKSLSSAYAQLNQLAEGAKQRLTLLSTNLSKVGQEASQKINITPKKFTSYRPKILKIKSLPSPRKPTKTSHKSLTLKPNRKFSLSPKQNIVPQRGIGALVAPERRKSLAHP